MDKAEARILPGNKREGGERAKRAEMVWDDGGCRGGDIGTMLGFCLRNFEFPKRENDVEMSFRVC